MITLADFKKYEDLERQLKEFLCEKCNEFKEAKLGSIDYPEIPGKIECWDIRDGTITVWFSGRGHFDDGYWYDLSLEYIFNQNFKNLMKAQFDEEHRKDELRILEYQKQHVEELELKAEQKRFEEIELMRELIKKYPEELFVSLVYQSPIHKVFKAFPEHGEFDISDIAGTALVSPSYVKSVLSSTIRDKFVKDLGNGKYTLTPEGIQMFKSKNI